MLQFAEIILRALDGLSTDVGKGLATLADKNLGGDDNPNKQRKKKLTFQGNFSVVSLLI